jgi:hypothetical protein
MYVYSVSKNENVSDHEDWHQWVESNIISYHSTPEKANEKIVELKEAEVVLLRKTQELNPHFAEEYWDSSERDIRDNILYDNAHGEPHDLFFVSTITVD